MIDASPNHAHSESTASNGKRLATSIRNLTKDYVLKSETVRALRGVSFDVPEGDYVAIMGLPVAARAHCSICWAVSINPQAEACILGTMISLR